MAKTRIGIIGLGQIAKVHLKNYAEIPDVEIVAACDVNGEELTKTSDLYSISDRYTDFRKILEREDIEAVDVCLHNNFHASVTIAALESGKHVYCEKPIAGSYADGAAMVQASEKAGRMLHIQLSTLYSRETKTARRLIDDGKLGRIYHARSNGFRRRGRPYVDGYGAPTFVQKEKSAGGAMFDMGVYHIAQVLYLMGLPPIERITGKVYQETPIDEKRAKASGYNVEELGVGFVRMANGVTLDIIEAWAMNSDPLEGSLIAGSLGGVRLSPFGFFTNVSDLAGSMTFDLGAEDFRIHALEEGYGAYDSSQHHWAAVLQGRVKLLPTAKIALDTMLIQEGIYLSDRLGREVTTDDVVNQSVSTAVKL